MSANQISFDHRANRVTSPLRSVGGRLSIDGDRLVFRPNVAEKALMVKEWSVPLSDIAGTDVAPINPLQLLSGGIRTRLALRLRDGSTQLFVLRDPKRRAAELRELSPPT